jgi:hypothetical protein
MLPPEVALGTLTAAKKVAADFDCFSFGNIALALRVECHLIIRRRNPRPAARASEIILEQKEQQEDKENENKQTEQQALTPRPKAGMKVHE